MDFNAIVGQEEVIGSLKGAIKSSKIGHAYMFYGPKGIGKSTVARVFAGLLLCNGNYSNVSCKECPPCLMYNEGSNPDFHIIESSGASIGVEDIRKLQSDVIIRPMYSQRKVYLIRDADKMTVQAQNSLLKTLEEPPEYTVIILTASNYDALLETIRSRVLKYSFKKNSYSEVKNLLEARFGGRLKGLDFIASYSDGIVGTALELAGSDDFVLLREKVVEIIVKLMDSRLLSVFEIYDFFEANKNNVDTIFNIMLSFYRDLLVVKGSGKEKMLINSDKKDIIVSNAPGFSISKLIANIETIEAAHKNIKQNANYQLSIEVMLMKLQEEDH
ncbi:MAG: AAA family ATPase [Clostridia bacterium]|nr:AAA family ATPase [Clostridia bacterium]